MKDGTVTALKDWLLDLRWIGLVVLVLIALVVVATRLMR